MKAFDRACIILLIWVGVLMVCAFGMTRAAGAVAIASTVVLSVFLVYENRIMHYEEKAEYYRKLFMKQNKLYLDTVLEDKEENSSKERTKFFDLTSFGRRRRKSGIDNSKVS